MDFVIFGKVVVPIEGITVESSTTHKNYLICLLSDFTHHFALNKGESWINWGSKLVLLTENQLILVRVQTPLSDKKEPPTNNVERFLAMLRFDSKEKIK